MMVCETIALPARSAEDIYYELGERERERERVALPGKKVLDV